MSREEEPETPSPPAERGRETHSAVDARQGEIILRTRRRRMIFIGGLAGIVLLGLLLRLCSAL